MERFYCALDAIVAMKKIRGVNLLPPVRNRQAQSYIQPPNFVTFLRHICKCLIIKGRSRCFG